MEWRLLRDQMIEDQLLARGIRDPRVIAAMREVPRHLFVPEALQDQAYADRALPLGDQQSISQPYIVGVMLQALQLSGTEKVLEIGTGSGYNAALLGRLAAQVHTIEIVPLLAETAKAKLETLPSPNVSVHLADGANGLPMEAPFDAIVLTAATDKIPPPLESQLSLTGRILMPLKHPLGGERLTLLWHDLTGRKVREFTECAFVPLVGRYGLRG